MSRIKRYNSTTQQWEYADLALQDDGSKESKSNKLLSVSGGGAGITSSATDTQYPSAKAVYDFMNKPSIPAAQVQADWNESDNTKADYIKNKPTIPTAGTITSGSTGYATGGDVYNAIQGGGGGIDYSTTEQDTGLKWIDGKPIYQITFTKQITSADSWASVSHSIPFQSIISINASYNYVQDNQAKVVPMPYYESSNARTLVMIWQTNIYFQISISFPINGTAVLTIRYTKTTD